MQPIDWAIVGAYLAGLVLMAGWLARRKVTSSEDYFLGGNRLPWWALGASGMSSNLDVAGTMAIVAMISLYGLHGLFIEMRGGVVLPIAVFLAFMGRWHRRSQVMTTAEWMLLRFGPGGWGQAARLIAALTYVILTVAMIVFFVTAGGRFLAEFLPYTPLQCSVGVAMVAFTYTLVGGLDGVIWTDVFQTVLIGAAALYVAVVAAGQVTPELLQSWPGAGLNQFWPKASDPRLAPYIPFWPFLLVWAGKGLLEGLGGSGGSAYMAQRFYAARTEEDCRKIGLLWLLLFSLRWPMVLGFCILALKLGLVATTLNDAEAVLPLVLNSEFFPSGLRGLVIAAMLAAAMSTFDSTINAGASYLVRDLYQPIRPSAGLREIVWAGYGASALVVALGLGLALWLGASVLGLWVGIVMLLFPAFLVPFALRWLWARFNGAGFVCGVVGGFAGSLWFVLRQPAGWNEATQFLAVAATSTLTSVLGTLGTPPVDEGKLRLFYDRVRPFGWWPAAWQESSRLEHRQDLRILVAAVVWQMLSFLLPMGLMLRMWASVVPAGLLWIILGWYLWPRTPTGGGLTSRDRSHGA